MAQTAEKIPDVEDKEPTEQGAVNEQGLTVDEQAEFDAMRTGSPTPAGEEQEGDADTESDADGETASGDADGDAVSEPAAGKDAPSDKEPAAVADPNKKAPPKTVNYSKYQRELQKANKAAEDARAAAQAEREQRLRLNERVSLINEALQQQAAQPPAEDPNAPPANPFEEQDIDPTVDYAAALDQERRRNRHAYEAAQNTTQEFTSSRADQEMKSTFEKDFVHFANTVDRNIYPAYQHLKDARLTQIFLAQYDKDPTDPNEQFSREEVQEAVRLFNAEEKWLVGEAIKHGRSPAAAIMKQAKILGFKPAEAAPAPAAKAPAAAAPRAPAPAARAPVAAPAASQQLAELNRNVQDGKSLSDGGGAPPGGLTGEILLALSDEEFAEMIDGMSDHQLNTILGKVPM